MVKFLTFRKMLLFLIAAILFFTSLVNINQFLQDTSTSHGNSIGIQGQTDDEDDDKNRVLIPLLHDKTITWSPNITRLWLDDSIKEKPPAQLLLTNYGWNGRNQTRALQFYRTKRQRTLLKGLVDHPWFHPTAWEQQYQNNSVILNNNTRYYVFLDVETCFESNWPGYMHGLQRNADVVGDRTTLVNADHCDMLQDALSQPFLKIPGSKLIYLDCSGWGPERCNIREGSDLDDRLAVVSLSARTDQQIASVDQGLPPPAGKVFDLTSKQVEDIQTCNNASRPILASFVGNFRAPIRKQLKGLNNCHDILVRHTKVHPCPVMDLSYEELLIQSKFALAPRGDNLFSYRFTEAISAGAIPIVYADHWALPFRPELVDWNECIVVIDEASVNQTRDILWNMTPPQECQMRQNLLDLYLRFIRTPQGTIAGIIEGLEHAFLGTRANYSFSPH